MGTSDENDDRCVPYLRPNNEFFPNTLTCFRELEFGLDSIFHSWFVVKFDESRYD